MAVLLVVSVLALAVVIALSAPYLHRLRRVARLLNAAEESVWTDLLASQARATTRQAIEDAERDLLALTSPKEDRPQRKTRARRSSTVTRSSQK